jgi:hypothetical protein
MRTRIIVVSALMASFSIAVSSAAWAQMDALKAGGVDTAEVAIAYYDTIDPYGLRETQAEWREKNGFNDLATNRIIDARGYNNVGDLGFYRGIEMVRDKRRGKKGNIAFTTVNYNSQKDANQDKCQVSVVNREYSQGPDGDDMLVKFYVFEPKNDPAGTVCDADDTAPNSSPDAGMRVLSTAFPGSDELFVPAACYSCHGGDDDAETPIVSYNEGSGQTNATFLLFDVATMTFDGVNQANLEAKFRKFNKAVLRADPTKATRKLAHGLYGGPELPYPTQDTDYIPDSWVGDQDLYRQVVVPSCRTCHTASDTKLLSLEWWKDNVDEIREEVFHEYTMPNSPAGFTRFHASGQSDILEAWLDTH